MRFVKLYLTFGNLLWRIKEFTLLRLTQLKQNYPHLPRKLVYKHFVTTLMLNSFFRTSRCNQNEKMELISLRINKIRNTCGFFHKI